MQTTSTPKRTNDWDKMSCFMLAVPKFHKKRAWFSCSVKHELCSFWLSEGGIIASWRTADYLFSEDATAADTQRIFESKDYLWDKVTVFHSLYLAACEKADSVKYVSIGHYVLPPACVQEEVRKAVGRFIWEQDNSQSSKPDIRERDSKQTAYTKDTLCCEESSISSGSESDAGFSENEAILCCQERKYPINNIATGYRSIDTLMKYSGTLCDVMPAHFRGHIHVAQCYRQGRSSSR